MIKPEQKRARDLSRRHRDDRLLNRAVYRAARKAKTPPPGFPEERTYTALETDEGGAKHVKRFLGGAAFPKEWL